MRKILLYHCTVSCGIFLLYGLFWLPAVGIWGVSLNFCFDTNNDDKAGS